jgi:hypothetical protein
VSILVQNVSVNVEFGILDYILNKYAEPEELEAILKLWNINDSNYFFDSIVSKIFLV